MRVAALPSPQVLSDSGSKATARTCSYQPTLIMGLFSPTFETLRDLYLNELRDLYSAETQLTEALPKMAEAASSSQLRVAFTSHLEETEGHIADWRRSSRPWARSLAARLAGDGRFDC